MPHDFEGIVSLYKARQEWRTQAARNPAIKAPNKVIQFRV